MDREQDATTTMSETLEASQPFLGRWQKLISTTNWEKGQIIHEWRAALMAENAPTTEYSDEAWSQIVGGNITGQHAGRLRRTYERFGDVYSQYQGLYWSHFQATLDWEDAEMWLEGAVQNKWSVAVMRRERWKATGGAEGDEPRETDVVTTEVDEDFISDERDASAEERNSDSDPSSESSSDESDSLISDGQYSEAVSPEGPDFGDADDLPSTHRDVTAGDSSDSTDDVAAEAEALVAPFADLPDLPEDVASAFESFQLAILRHKGEEWAAISSADMLASLDALKALVTAP